MIYWPFLFKHFSNIFYNPLLGLFWKTDRGRTDKISKGCFSIHWYLSLVYLSHDLLTIFWPTGLSEIWHLMHFHHKSEWFTTPLLITLRFVYIFRMVGNSCLYLNSIGLTVKLSPYSQGSGQKYFNIGHCFCCCESSSCLLLLLWRWWGFDSTNWSLTASLVNFYSVWKEFSWTFGARYQQLHVRLPYCVKFFIKGQNSWNRKYLFEIITISWWDMCIWWAPFNWSRYTTTFDDY